MSALILVESNHSSLHFFTTYFFSFQIETENHFVNFTKGLFDKNIATVKGYEVLQVRWNKLGHEKIILDDIDFFLCVLILTFTLILQVLLCIFTQFTLMMTVIISFQQANERLLGPSSHVVEVGVRQSQVLPDWAGARHWLSPLQEWLRPLRPVSVSSVIITARFQLGYSWVLAGKVGLLHFSEEFEILLQSNNDPALLESSRDHTLH